MSVSTPDSGRAWRFFRFGLIVTGEGEERADGGIRAIGMFSIETPPDQVATAGLYVATDGARGRQEHHRRQRPAGLSDRNAPAVNVRGAAPSIR